MPRLRTTLRFCQERIKEAQRLWPDSVALAVFLSFLVGVNLIFSFFWPTAGFAAVSSLFTGGLILIGFVLLAVVALAIRFPLYGGLACTGVYGAMTLIAVTFINFNPVSLCLWLGWFVFAIRGSTQRIRRMYKAEGEWDALFDFQRVHQSIIPFYLVRLQDATEQGVGKVAEGVVLSNGSVLLTARNPDGGVSLTQYPTLPVMRRAFLATGKTVIVWPKGNAAYGTDTLPAAPVVELYASDLLSDIYDPAQI